MNTTYTAYTYDQNDPRYFMEEIGHYGSDDELLMDYPITYDTRDDSGNPNVIADWDDPSGRAYTYDANNRLSSAAGTSYGYDWVGNRLNPPANPSPMVYDPTDKLVTWPGQHQYTYYPTGSLHEQKNSGGTVQKTFAYTGAELLSSVTHAGVANPSLMEWDADSNRVSFTSSTGGTTEFVYDTTAGIPAVLEEWDGEASVYYIREPGGELIARMAGASKQYYHFDELGSTRLLTNDSGTVTDTYAYDAWGKLTDHDRQTGSVDQPYLFVGQLGYYSHYQDENLFDDEYPTDPQFLQLGVRFYDPQTGRFTQMDAARDGMHWYAYAAGSPTISVDPTGLMSMGKMTCEKLASEIKRILNKLKGRYKDMLEDKNHEWEDWYRNGGGTIVCCSDSDLGVMLAMGRTDWKGHQNAFYELQNKLNNLKQAYSDNGCGGDKKNPPQHPIPADTMEWIQKKAPEMPDYARQPGYKPPIPLLGCPAPGTSWAPQCGKCPAVRLQLRFAW